MGESIEKRMGVRIAALRQFRNIPPEVLAEAIGCTKKRITRIERGSSAVTIGETEALARTLGVSIGVLTGEEPFEESGGEAKA